MPDLRLGDTARGFAHVLGGAVGAQAVALAALPLLSRIYQPEAFGTYTLVLALVAVITPLSTLRFETAAMLPDNAHEVRAIVWNALLATVTTALLAGVLVEVLAACGIEDLLRYPGVSIWVAVLTLLGGIYLLFSQLALRKRKYALVGRRTLLRSVATAFSQVGMGLAGGESAGLLGGAAAGSAVGVSTMVRQTTEFLAFPGFRALRATWRDYWHFPVVFTPSALLNGIGLQGPVIFFTLWFGVGAGGQLGMAERIIALPIAVIGSAVGQIVDAEASQRIRESRGGLLRMYLRLSAPLAGVSLVAGAGFGLLGPLIVPWVLGKEWQMAGSIVQVLAVTGAIRMLANPLSRFLLLLKKPLANSVIDLVRVVLVCGAMVIAISVHLDLVQSLWFVYSALSATYLVTWVYVAVVIWRNER